MNNKKITNVKIIILLGILYLLLPNIIWLLGWVRWYFALPVAFLLMAGCVRIYINIRCKSLIINRTIVWNLIFILFSAFICTESLGLHGHTLQGWDFTHRNPIYETLVRCDWPLYTQNGDYFIYYSAYWLFPALLSKLTINYISFLDILWVWNFLSIVLAFLLFLIRFKEKTWLFVLLVLSLGSINDCFNFFFILMSHLTSYFNMVAFYVEGSKFFCYVSNWTALCANTPHLVLPILILLSLFYSRCIPFQFWPYISALTVFWSPLTAFAVFILLVVNVLFKINKNNIIAFFMNNSLYSAIILLILVALYFMNAHAQSVHLVFQDSNYYNGLIQNCIIRISKAIFNVLIILIPLLIFLRRYKRTAVFQTIYIISICTPLIWIGRNFNELIFKSSIVLFILLAILFTFEFKHITKCKRYAIIAFLFLSTFACQWDIIARVLQHYSWDKKVMNCNYRDDWQGHLNHADDFYYKHFFGKQPLSFIFYDKQGESAQHIFKLFETTYKADDDKPIRLK